MAIQSITASQATVKTASVDVRVLTISGKQVTLAVFRQLIEETLVNARDGTLAGVPWGKVAYCPGKACSLHDRSPGHLHIVWQKGDQLRRAAVPERWPDPTNANVNADLFLRAALFLEVATLRERHPRASLFESGHESGFRFRMGFTLPSGEKASRSVVLGEDWQEKRALVDATAVEPPERFDPTDWRYLNVEKNRESAVQWLRNRAKAIAGADDWEEAERGWEWWEAECATGKTGWRKAFATLDALDQLFIAV